MALQSTDDKAMHGHCWDPKFCPPVGKAVDAMQDVPDAQDVNSWKMGPTLTQWQRGELQELLLEEPQIWAWNDGHIGRTIVVAHTIDTREVLLLKQRLSSVALAEEKMVDAEAAK